MRSQTLIGRDVEQRLLRELVGEVGDGAGATLVILGEAGIGKTSLATALAGEASRASMTVGWGRCSSGETPAYWPWTTALRALGAAMPEAGEGHGSRASLFARVVELLANVTRARPCAVIIEDVHWADASSLALLRFVVDAMPGMPLLLAATARDDPAEISEDTAGDLAGLPAHVRRLQLGGLDAAGVATLVERVAGQRPDPGLVDEIERRTGGNPFFVTEIARLRSMRDDHGPFDVPPAVRQALSRRIARLSQPAAELLELATVLGEPHAHDLAALSGRPVDQVAELLGEATTARLLSRDGFGHRFAHALVRETVDADLGPATRARLHRRAALLLEERHDARAADLAWHWLQAGGQEGRSRGAAHAMTAAAEAVEGLAYEQAARYYRWALDSGVEDRLLALIGLGEAQVLAGQLRSGREILREPARAAAASGRSRELARAVLAMGSGVGGFEVDVGDAEQERLLTRALELLPPEDGALRAAVLGRLSLARAGAAPVEERVAMARAAGEMAQRIGDPAVEGATLAALCDALAGPDHVDERLVAADRILELAGGAGVEPLVLLARRLRVVALLERGEFGAVDREIGRYESVAARLRIPLFTWLVPLWRGMRADVDGEHERALELAAEVEAIGRRAESVNAELMAFTLRCHVLRVCGRSAEVLPLLERLRPFLEGYPGADCLLAAVYAESGETERGRRHLRRMLELGLESLPRDSELLELLWFLGDAAVALGEPEAARLVHDAMAPYAHLWCVDGIGGACFGPVSVQLDRLAAYVGAPGTGAGSPDAAETAVFRRLGAVWRLRYRGAEAMVPHTKGMSDLAELLGRPGRELHVLDLIEAGGGPAAAAAGTDTGPILDAQARSEYGKRLRELEEELADAASAQDAVRAELAAAERDAVTAELGRAFGLGGRPRRGGDRAERARKAVTMRLGTAVRVIEITHPALGRHLRASLRTGRFCTYQPEFPVAWQVSRDVAIPVVAPPG